jgi:hypothetical protein
MGEGYPAQDTKLERKAALKILRSKLKESLSMKRVICDAKA